LLRFFGLNVSSEENYKILMTKGSEISDAQDLMC